ncbi:flagellar biosynthetic protein FliR [Zhenpiania hominis]|uniref:Flagellar biosynthetic protein FliR n=1 Tax=Zhenpiania hominis TaxID=2763644 RepID=A0A923NLM2_9FIRM|nr:flagellar biosynthetic protein FliR [Zhenpiania hominis]MBC6678323.1 flagellar biosynthetic protein FliR [Zhenpiania hominis]
MLIAGTQEFMLFSLILMRMSGFIFLNPVLGRRNIPSIAKTGMALALTILIYFVAEGTELNIGSPLEFGLLLLKEFVIGYFLGFVMVLFEFAVTYAGSIADFMMGLSMSTVYDAQNGIQVALTGNILQIYFILLFFAVDGHLALMNILVTSADIVPYGQIAIGSEVTQAVIEIFCRCVELAVKLVFPLIAIELLMDIGTGILMKIIPQINLFVLSIQMRVILGIIMMLLLISPIGDFLGDLIGEMMRAVQHMLTTV